MDYLPDTLTEYLSHSRGGTTWRLPVSVALVVDTQDPGNDFALLTCTRCRCHKVVAVGPHKVYQCANGCKTLDPGVTDGRVNVHLALPDALKLVRKNHIDKLARTFHAKMREDLAQEEAVTSDVDDKTRPAAEHVDFVNGLSSRYEAAHDLFDANDTMIDAFEAVIVPYPKGGYFSDEFSEYALGIQNEAWAIAKARGYAKAWPARKK